MNQLDTIKEREFVLEDGIKRLDAVNKRIAKYTVEKEALTAEIIAALGHFHEGEKSYEYGLWKVTCKTPMTYSLNTKAYRDGDIVLPEEFNPIRESITYTVDKKLFEEHMKWAPQDIRESLCELVTKKDSKASVNIKAKA